MEPQEDNAFVTTFNKRMQAREKILPLNFGTQINNSYLGQVPAWETKNRCSGSPSNYCFPYYFPNTFRKMMASNPALVSQAIAGHQRVMDQQPLSAFNSDDPAPQVLIDIIYSQQRDGELTIEFNEETGKLSLLTFIDISQLYNDKQLFAYEMAQQLSALPPHPYLLNIQEPHQEIQQRNTIVFKTDCPQHISLWKQFCKTNFSTPRLLLIFRQLTSALSHMHAHGLVHRDIHPTRLHWSNGRPVFNLIGLPYNYLKLLKGKNFAGHLPFSAPELLAKQSAFEMGAQQVSPAVDIWSLGCCLYYFVVKKDPFEGALHDKQHNRTKANIMNMTIGDMKINDPLVNKLLNACLIYDASTRPTAEQLMQLQDQLETQEYGLPRSKLAMDFLDANVDKEAY